MKISIVPESGTVTIDGQMHKVDMRDLPSYIHAIQWDDSLRTGYIEFKPDTDGRHHPNMKIVDFTPYDFIIDRWRVQKAEDEKVVEALRRKTEAEIEVANRIEIHARGAQQKAKKPSRMK